MTVSLGLVVRQNGGGQLVLIPPGWIHRTDQSTKKILADGIHLDPLLVEQWSLRPGDLVKFDQDPAGLAINSVNGLKSPTASVNRPDFMADFVGKHRLQFPARELPIDLTGNVGMRMLRTLAPMGLGSQLIIDGPASSGKTWTSQILAKALLTCAAQGQVLTTENCAFVFLSVGERPPDVGKLKAMIGHTYGEGLGMDPVSTVSDPFPGVHRELYFGFSTDEAVLNARVALERSRRLVEMGFHVLLFVDSIWGLVLAMGGALNGSASGLAAAGVPREALKMVKDEFLFAGTVPDGSSLTLIITCLYEGPKTSSETVLNEIGAPSATARWRHRLEPDASTPRPWIEIGAVTGTRELGYMFGEARMSLHLELQRRSGLEGGPAERLAYLRRLFGDTAFDEKAIRAKWAREQQERAAAAFNRAVETLTRNGANALSQIADPLKAARTVLEMVKAGRSGLSDLVEALKWIFDGLTADERAQFFALLEKNGLMPEKKAPQIPADQAFLAAAETLRNSEVIDKAEVARKGLAKLGFTPEELIAAKATDPVEAMMGVADRLKAETSNGFGRKTAEALVTAGYQPDEVYQRLLSGASPKQLLSERARARKK